MLKSIRCFITIAFAVASQTTGSGATEAPWDRTVLPRPPQPFQGVTKRSLEGSVASFTQPVRAPANAPNIVLVLIDDAGFGNPSTFGGPVATPALDKLPHTPGRAKSVIFLFMEGGTSQVDLFDPKPKLNELNGQKLPDSFTKNVRFTFLQKDTAVLLGTPHKFRKYGKASIEISEMFPQIGSCVDDIALVRSMHTRGNDHPQATHYAITGHEINPAMQFPSLGSIITKELGARKIRVNAINPGPVETEGTHAAGVIGSDVEKAWVAQTPLGRIGQPGDIASVALFLASDESSYITGSEIHVDGGAIAI